MARGTLPGYGRQFVYYVRLLADHVSARKDWPADHWPGLYHAEPREPIRDDPLSRKVFPDNMFGILDPPPFQPLLNLHIEVSRKVGQAFDADQPQEAFCCRILGNGPLWLSPSSDDLPLRRVANAMTGV